MGPWVSTCSFYQLISGSRSNGITAIILHYKYQTIYFCRDAHRQLLLPACILFPHMCLRNCRRASFILPAFGSIESYESTNESFSEDLSKKKKKKVILSLFSQELECTEEKLDNTGMACFCSCLVFCSLKGAGRVAQVKKARLLYKPFKGMCV